MIQKLYSIRDSKVGTYGPIYPCATHGEAERALKQVIADPQSMVAKFPEDFDLYYMGEYDTNSGKLLPLDTPLHLAKAVVFLQAAPTQPLREVGPN